MCQEMFNQYTLSGDGSYARYAACAYSSDAATWLLTRMHFMNTESQITFSSTDWHHHTWQTYVFTAAEEERQMTVCTPELRNDSTDTSWPEPSGSSIKPFCVFSIGNCRILTLYSLNLHLTSHKKSRVCSVAAAAMCRQSLSLYLILLTSARWRNH
jgi:hypothetical protein